MNENDLIQVLPTQASEGIQALPTPEEAGVSFPVHLANERADKLHTALGEQSPGREQLIGSLSTSTGEQQERLRLASQEAVRDKTIRSGMLSDMLRNKTEITTEDLAKARELAMDKPIDPDTVVEKIVARDYVDPPKTAQELIKFMGADVSAEYQAKVQKFFEDTEPLKAKKEFAERIVQDIEGRIEKMSFNEKALFMPTYLVPGVQWYRTYDKTKDGVLAGSNITSQVEDFLMKPLEEGGKELKDKIEALYKTNPLMALDLAKRFASNTTFEQGLDNLFAIADLAGVPSVAKAALGSARSLVGASVTNWAQQQAARGNASMATRIRAFDELKARALGQTTPTDFAELESVLPSVANPGAFYAGGSNVINPAGVARVVAEQEQFADKALRELILERNFVDRTDPKLQQILMNDNIAVFKARYPNTHNGIMDVSWQSSLEDGAANVNSLVVKIGTHKAEPIATENLAHNLAKDFYGLSDYEVKQIDKTPGFFIETKRHVDENITATYADLTTSTKGSKFNYLGFLGSADNFFTSEVNAARKQAGYGVSAITDTMTKTLKGIPSMVDQDFNKFLMHGLENEITYYTSKDMENAYQRMFGKLPTEQQIKDYDKVVKIHDIDLAVRDLSLLSKKASQGFETHILPYLKFGEDLPKGLTFDNNLNRVTTSKKAVNDNLRPMNSNVNTKALGAANDNPFQVANDIGSVGFRQGDQKLGTAFPTGQAANDLRGPNQNLNVLRATNDNTPTKAGLEIEGKFLKNGIPWDLNNRFTVAIWNEDPTKVQFVRKIEYTSGKRVQELDDLVNNQGYKVIQPSPHSRDAMRQLGLDMPEFILVKDFKSERLSFNQIPKKEGSSHVVYPKDGVFISQADVHVANRGGTRESSYVGNNNFLFFDNHGQGTKYLEHIEQARQMLKNNDPRLSRYLANNLPFSVKEFSDFFKAFNKNGRFDVEQPFIIRRHGEQAVDSAKNYRNANGDLLYPNLENYADSPLNPFNGDSYLRFAQERSELLNTITEASSNGGAAFQLRPATILNPKDAMVDATESLMSSRYLDDLKVKSARDWVTRYKDILNVPMEDLLRDPMKYVTNPSFKPGADSTLMSQAKNSRRATMEFLNIDSPAMRDMKNMMTRIYESIFPEDTAIRNGIERIDDLSGKALTDPATWARRWAFRATQITPQAALVQATQVVNAVSIAGPAAGARGAAQAMLWKVIQAGGEADNLVSMLANRYAKFTGTKPEHFKEAIAAYKRSGFGDVMEEHAMAEGFNRPSVMKQGFEKGVDAGLVFFREGERVTREVAWYSAYHQWRAANPTAKLTKAMETELLAKADAMAGNMSKASNAMWSNGILAVPTQFLKYQSQLAEQVLIGRDLTPAERSRLLAGQTIMWGVPVGTVGAVAGVVYPWQESIAQYLRERGIDTDANKVAKIANDGVASVLFEMATGEKYDVAGRFGPKGNSVLKDLQTGRKELVEILSGPSGKILYDTYKTGARALTNTLDMMFATTDENNPNFKPTLNDLLDVGNNFTAVRQGYELWNALYLNRWVTKNRPGGLDGVTDQEAWTRFISGVTPERIQEHFSKQDAVMSHEKMQKDYEKQIANYYRQMYAAVGDEATQKDYAKRIETLYVKGGFTSSERYVILGRAVSDNRDTMESVNRKYLQKFPGAQAIVEQGRLDREQITSGVNR